jgi:peptidyl-prolyl cis-trans isomerase C
VRHILVKTEDEAKAIIADLDKGGDFAKIATEKSQDPGSAAKGGDIGFIGKGVTVKPFEEAAFALETGTYTKTPIQSDYGWHIIKVEEKRNRKAPDFDQVKSQIETYVGRKAQADYVAKLRETAKVERMDQPDVAAKPDAAKPDAAKDSKMAPSKK